VLLIASRCHSLCLKFLPANASWHKASSCSSQSKVSYSIHSMSLAAKLGTTQRKILSQCPHRVVRRLLVTLWLAPGPPVLDKSAACVKLKGGLGTVVAVRKSIHMIRLSSPFGKALGKVACRPCNVVIIDRFYGNAPIFSGIAGWRLICLDVLKARQCIRLSGFLLVPRCRCRRRR